MPKTLKPKTTKPKPAERAAGVEKTRVVEKTFLTRKEADEVTDFVNGDWLEPNPPKPVKSWQVLLDDEVETLELAAPVIDFKKLKAAVDSSDWGQALEHETRVRNPVTNSFDQVQTLLVMFKGFKGHYDKHAGGLVNRDSIEACTLIPDHLRKKLFLLLPQCLNVQPK